MFTAAEDFLAVEVSVEAYLGEGAKGPTFAPAATIPCYLGDGRKVVRGPSGEQVVSQGTLFADPAYQASFPALSKVTGGGRTARVITSTLNAIGDPDVDHVEVALT